MRLKTVYVYPPIPYRGFDWCAYDDKTYCGSESDVIGRGSTEQEAIDDLLEQLAEAA